MSNLAFKRLIYFLKPKPPFIQFLTTDSQTLAISPTEPSPSFTLKFLNNSCGLSLERALSASRKFELKEEKSNEHESVLLLLKSYDFSDSQIKKLVTKCPRILQSKVHNNLNPKLKLLSDYGFQNPILADVITTNPSILLRSLDDHLKPTLEFLKTYVHKNENVVLAVKRSTQMLTFDCNRTMQPNIEFMLSEGVPVATIAKHIVRQPRTLMMKLNKTVKAVEKVKELGLNPKSDVFLEAIRITLSFSDSTWQSKVDIFKSFGWSEDEIMFAFKRKPAFLAGSEEKIRALMDFYLNCLKLDRAVLLKSPKFLTLGLNTRVLPRYNVVKILKEKKLMKDDKKFLFLLQLSEKQFIAILDKHLEEVPDLMETYRSSRQ